MHRLSPLPLEPIRVSYNEIIPNLFIGDYKSTKHVTQFKLIVNCTRHIPFPICIGIDKIRVPIDDVSYESANLLGIAPQVIEKIHRALQKGHSVLVHCHAGMQRSCTIVAMYLMKYNGINQKSIDPPTAIQFIQSKRSIAFQPKPTFGEAMKEFHKNLV